jgi:hypothetical protein
VKKEEEQDEEEMTMMGYFSCFWGLCSSAGGLRGESTMSPKSEQSTFFILMCREITFHDAIL